MTYTVLHSPQIEEPIEISVDASEVMARLSTFGGTVLERVQAFGNQIAGEAETYMKLNAPWTDRTAAARASLFGRSWEESNVVIIHLAQKVDYGIWLELRWLGRYAILSPTMYVFVEEVSRRLGVR